MEQPAPSSGEFTADFSALVIRYLERNHTDQKGLAGVLAAREAAHRNPTYDDRRRWERLISSWLNGTLPDMGGQEPGRLLRIALTELGVPSADQASWRALLERTRRRRSTSRRTKNAKGDVKRPQPGDSVDKPADAMPPGGRVGCRVVGVPARPELFVGRGTVLAALDEAFSTGPAGSAPAAGEGAPAGGVGRVVVQAVHGLGGIGKSTVAAHWALEHTPGYELVGWITADSPTGIETGLADLAVALDPDGAAGVALEARRERAVAWLAGHEGWLLVLDNVTDPHPACASQRLANGRP